LLVTSALSLSDAEERAEFVVDGTAEGEAVDKFFDPDEHIARPRIPANIAKQPRAPPEPLLLA
jgi:hypothetical protein